MWGRISINKIMIRWMLIMKKTFSKLITSIVVGSLCVMPVQAAPDTSEIQSEMNAAQSQVNSLQNQLSDVLNQIYKLEEDMISTGEKINQATVDLEAAQELEKKQYEDMKLRIRYMYEDGDVTALEKIFTSGNISELLNQAEYVETVHGYDRQMLDEYIATKNTISELKTTLETEMSGLETMQVEFSNQKASLNTMISSKQAEISNLDEQFQAAVQAAASEAQERLEEESQETNANENNGAGNANANTGNNTGENANTGNTNTGNTNVGNGNNNSSGNSTNNNTGNNTGNSNAGNSNTGNSNTGNSNTGNSNTGNSTGSGSTGSNNSGSSNSNSSGNKTAAQAIVNAAYSQLGVKYVWGGTTPGVGLDCSGLTQYAHRQAGISIGRTSGVQGAGGKAVSSPQAGDLVCYAGHVGIYIGGGQMIHAPNTGAVVRVQSVYGSPWYRRYW